MVLAKGTLESSIQSSWIALNANHVIGCGEHFGGHRGETAHTSETVSRTRYVLRHCVSGSWWAEWLSAWPPSPALLKAVN